MDIMSQRLKGPEDLSCSMRPDLLMLLYIEHRLRTEEIFLTPRGQLHLAGQAAHQEARATQRATAWNSDNRGTRRRKRK